MNFEEYLQSLQEKLKMAGDVKLALTEEYQTLIALQNKMMSDISNDDFHFEAYLNYFDQKQVKEKTKESKKRNRKKNLRVQIVLLIGNMISFVIFPEVIFGFILTLSLFLLFKMKDIRQREDYRELCRSEIVTLASKGKNIEQRIRAYKSLEDSIQNAIEQASITSKKSMHSSNNMDEIVTMHQEYLPKLILSFEKKEK